MFFDTVSFYSPKWVSFFVCLRFAFLQFVWLALGYWLLAFCWLPSLFPCWIYHATPRYTCNRLSTFSYSNPHTSLWADSTSTYSCLPPNGPPCLFQTLQFGKESFDARKTFRATNANTNSGIDYLLSTPNALILFCKTRMTWDFFQLLRLKCPRWLVRCFCHPCIKVLFSQMSRKTFNIR